MAKDALLRQVVLQHCGKLAQLQTQHKKKSSLAQKRLTRDFFHLFVKGLRSDRKVTKKGHFDSQSDSKVTFGAQKSHLLVSFEPLYKKEKKSLFSLF